MASFILFLFLTVGSLLASETDAFSVIGHHFTDLTQELNLEIQHRMDLAVSNANRIGGCKNYILKQEMAKVLRGGLVGRVENWVNHSDLPKYHLEFEESIYKDAQFFDGPALHMTHESLGSIIMLNNEIIGTDKLGHFFDEGWILYLSYKRTGKLKAGFNYSDATEKGMYGLMATGVYSYADKVANYQGMLFWSRLIKTNDSRIPQDWSYIQCEDGEFVITRLFDWSEYVDGSWDETINCNRYSKTMGPKVLDRLNEMNLSCPTSPTKCVDAVNKFGALKGHLLHPDCIQAAENESMSKL